MYKPGYLNWGLFLALLAGFTAYLYVGGYYAAEIVTEFAIFAILVLSLELVAGYGGMVSLCHGALFGLGAYLFGGLTTILGLPPIFVLFVAIILTALLGLALGAITKKIHGIYFIMATLAFGQLAFELIRENRILGGDDGMWGIERFVLPGSLVDFNQSIPFALLCLFFLLVSYMKLSWLLHSGFGRTLTGIRIHEDRMASLGARTGLVKALAFGISAGFAGFAGVLGAQHSQFISPDILHWTFSGEILIALILGGIGSLTGAVFGAAALVLLKHFISGWSEYWHLFTGLILVLVVMSGSRGIWGLIDQLSQRSGRPHA